MDTPKETPGVAPGTPVILRVLQQGKDPVDINTKTGEILRDALLDNKVDLYDMWGKAMNCGGGGNCLTCVVDVKSGCGERSEYENGKLKNKPKSWRLACQTEIE